jgi:hypothetical protein
MSAKLAIAAVLALAAVGKLQAARSGSRSARSATWPQVRQSMLGASAKHAGGPRDARWALGYGEEELVWTRERYPVAGLKVEPVSAADVRRYARRMDAGEQPPPVVLAERDPGRFAVIDGAHRVAAAKHLGLAEVDAWVGRLPAHTLSRGSENRASFRMLRDVPPGYSTASWLFVRGLTLEDAVDELDEDEGEEPTDDHRLYHVTTSASAVLASRLKSRKQLRGQGVLHAGLGGGGSDEAAELVSVAVTLSRALAIRDGLKVMVRAARKEIDTVEALIAAMAWNDFPNRFMELKRYDAFPDDEEEGYDGDGASAYDEMMRSVMDTINLPEQDVGEPPTTGKKWIQWIEENRSMINEQDPYAAVVRFESKILDQIDLFPDVISICSGGVGFTMTSGQMARIDPSEIKILLVAAKGSPVDDVPIECELRFRSSQLVVVGVEA